MKDGKNMVSEKISDLYNKYGINKSFSISYLKGNEETHETVKDEVELINKLIKLKGEGSIILKIQENKVNLTNIYIKIYQ